ncbi:MAG TPA: hypothetical protein PLK77_02700 [Pyrinomonadaceae bacterium]|nr:hypothetical protein [Pyrinomonadaceae bacterium]
MMPSVMTASSATDYHSKKAAQAGSPINRTAWIITAIVVIAIIVIAIISIVAAVAIIDLTPNGLSVHATVMVTVLPDMLSAVAITSAVLCVGGYASEAQKGDAKDREHYAAS